MEDLLATFEVELANGSLKRLDGCIAGETHPAA